MEPPLVPTALATLQSKSMGSKGHTAGGEDSPTHRLGAAVRARRRALRLNQAELASLSGVGLAFLYELEHGKPTLRIDKVLSVLDVLGLELHVRAGKQGLTVSPELA
jgi:HTH-type transcriptional regulator/antitoxin HipB